MYSIKISPNEVCVISKQKCSEPKMIFFCASFVFSVQTKLKKWCCMDHKFWMYYIKGFRCMVENFGVNTLQ